MIITTLLGAWPAHCCWSRNPYIHFWALVWVRPNWNTSTGKVLVFLCRSGPLGSVICNVPGRLLCELTKYCWLNCHRWPILSLGNAGNHPGCASGLVLTKPPAQIPRHTCTNIKYWEHSSQAWTQKAWCFEDYSQKKQNIKNRGTIITNSIKTLKDGPQQNKEIKTDF